MPDSPAPLRRTPALWRRALLVAGALLTLAACSDPEPLRLGFLGGVSGRVADLGIAGRNGAMLAVELRNAAGGVDGRPVELIAEDDQQDAAVARAALDRLLAQRVAAVIGPMTSAMAMAVVPQANAAQLLLISPTVTTTALAGLDDHFLRVIAPTTEYAQKSARHHYAVQGARRIVAVADQRNAAYTASWLSDYRRAFEAAGGTIEASLDFRSSDATEFAGLAERLLAFGTDSILILANSVDTALLAQQLRQRDPAIRINTSEWAATERLIELGGRAVEGIVIAQFLDRESTQPAYLAFRQAYLARFGQEPGFAGLTGYDATNVALDGLARQGRGQTLKQAILAQREFAGAQSPIVFNDSGDASRESYLTTIRDGVFVRLR